MPTARSPRAWLPRASPRSRADGFAGGRCGCRCVCAVEVGEEVLEAADLFDVVLDPGLTLRLREEDRDNHLAEEPGAMLARDDQGVLVERAVADFPKGVFHPGERDAVGDRVVDVTLFVEFLDRGEDLDLVLR